MDANQQRFWLIAAPEQFRLGGTGAQWDAGRRVLRLASRRRIEGLSADRVAARALSDGPALAIDPFGTWARVSESRDQVLVGGVAEPELPLELMMLDADERITDLALAANGILYLALRRPDGAARVLLIDRRDRFAPAAIGLAGFSADRLAVAADGRIWALDRGAARLAQVKGEPLPRLAEQSFAPDTFRPSLENLDPPSLELLPEVEFAPGREIVACAADERGIVVLLWPEDGPSELQRIEHGRALPPLVIEGVPAAFDVGWLGGERFALAVAGENEALAIALPAETEPPASLVPLGDRYPLIAWQPGRFANAFVTPVRYPATEGGRLQPRPLHRLSLPSTTTRALVPVEAIDGGARGMVWHRLYLEAVLPPGCGLRVWLAAADDRTALDELPDAAFHPHDFGRLPSLPGDIARGVWLDQASELAFHDGFLDCPRARDRVGLFTCLIERPGHVVRALQGRFLAMRLELFGDGQAGPQIAALRAYGPRFSYRDRYLPELYRESADPSAAGPASGADFLDRFLALFESVLTPLEDQVAASWRLTVPDTAPPDALDWLAGWIGLSLEPGLEERQRRRMIRRATALYRRRGTLAGLAAMLDIVTDDGVRRGDLVIVEQFRLRRTFATILGADLADEDDPLTRGVAVSGNSYLGRTFHLGAEEQREFLALFRPAAVETANEAGQVAALLDGFANRATVLVHREMTEDRLRLVRRLAQQESPAHVETTVLLAGRPLVVALSSLLGVDSYLRGHAPRPGVEVQVSRLGGAFLRDAASLDPRVEGDRA
jgi:phage tail-like protein